MMAAQRNFMSFNIKLKTKSYKIHLAQFYSFKYFSFQRFVKKKKKETERFLAGCLVRKQGTLRSILFRVTGGFIEETAE